MPGKTISLTGPKSDEGHRWCRIQSECRSGTDVERRLNNDTGTTDTIVVILYHLCGKFKILYQVKKYLIMMYH